MPFDGSNFDLGHSAPEPGKLPSRPVPPNDRTIANLVLLVGICALCTPISITALVDIVTFLLGA